MDVDDFYGAECEMDDQMLIATAASADETEFNAVKSEEDEYDRKFREKEAEYTIIGNRDWTVEECVTLKKRISNSSRKPGNMEETVYPPERKPPIFDFFTVLTAFIVAVILAYYTISSY